MSTKGETLLERVKGREDALRRAAQPLIQFMAEADIHTVEIHLHENKTSIRMDARKLVVLEQKATEATKI